MKELFEKRLPVEKPKFSWSSNYLKKFEEFFNDQYGLRKTLIYLNAYLLDNIFDESPDARAVVGKDGWLFFDNRDSLLDASGKAHLDDKLIENSLKHFYKNWQRLKAKNIDYLLVIAADKSTIYPEFLPDYIKPGNSHRIDKFLAALKKKYPDFPVLDLRPILLKAKENEIIYHATDTHWNKRGTHYGYVAIMEKLGIKPHLRSEFLNTEEENFRGDISDIMGVSTTNINYDLQKNFNSLIREVSARDFVQFHKPRFFVNEDKNLPRLFVYKDSFFDSLNDLVSEHFSQSLYINEFPCDLKFENIKIFHPNLVIQQFWEGRVEEVLRNCKDNQTTN